MPKLLQRVFIGTLTLGGMGFCLSCSGASLGAGLGPLRLQCLLVCLLEPRLDGELVHPDVWFWIKGRWIWIDTTARNSCAPSNVHLSSQGMGVFFESIEAEKHGTYDALARKYGAEFFAVVVDVHGGLFGPEALKLFQEMIKLGAQVKSVWTPHQVVNGIYRSIAADICKGNEDIFDTNLRWNLGDDDRRPARQRRRR